MNIRQKLKQKFLQYHKYRYADKQYKVANAKLDSISVSDVMQDASDAKYYITKKIPVGAISETALRVIMDKGPDVKYFGHKYPCFVRYVETVSASNLLSDDDSDSDKEFKCPLFLHDKPCNDIDCFWYLDNISYVEKFKRIATTRKKMAEIRFAQQRWGKIRERLWNEFLGREKQ